MVFGRQHDDLRATRAQHVKGIRLNKILPGIRGTMPALLTPLTADLRFDEDGLTRLVQYVEAAGVNGLVVLGSTGEFQSIDWDQRSAIISGAVEAWTGNGPVLAGAGLPNLKATIDQIQVAADAGADGCLVTPPYYFPIDQDAIVAWFQTLIEASPIPIMYYHYPGMTKLVAEPATIVRMRDLGLAGIKDSGGTLVYLQQVLECLAGDRNFRVMVGGDGHFLAALVHGADGTIGMQPSVVPEIDVQLFEAYTSGDLEDASAWQREAVKFASELLKGPGSNQAKGKAVLERLGICGRTVAPPMRTLTDSEAEETWVRVKDLAGARLGVH